MHTDIQEYNNRQTPEDKEICEVLAQELTACLPDAESKLWHAHPVWFLDGNPIAGYSRQKAGMRLMFWSGADFEEESLKVRGATFKDASVFYRNAAEIHTEDVRRWLDKARTIQWDYKNIVKRKGVLLRLK